MARNRKSESGYRPTVVATALTLFAVFVSLGVGYDWYQSQISDLGRQVKKSETLLGELRTENRVRRDQLAAACSPVALEARARQLNLGLGPPALAQVIHLADSSAVASTPPAPLELARAGGRETRN